MVTLRNSTMLSLIWPVSCSEAPRASVLMRVDSISVLLCSISCSQKKKSRQLHCATGEKLKLNRVEVIENRKSMLFLGDYITKKSQKKDHSHEQRCVETTCSRCWAWSCMRRALQQCEKCLHQTTTKRLDSSEAETSINCEHLDVFQKTPVSTCIMTQNFCNG